LVSSVSLADLTSFPHDEYWRLDRSMNPKPRMKEMKHTALTSKISSDVIKMENGNTMRKRSPRSNHHGLGFFERIVR
jgi:hypothetical protein